jgi:hypothetical protein
MAPDITQVTNLLLEDKIWGAVQHHIAYYHAPEVNVFPSNSQGTVHTTICYSCAAQIEFVHMATSDFD